MISEKREQRKNCNMCICTYACRFFFVSSDHGWMFYVKNRGINRDGSVDLLIVSTCGFDEDFCKGSRQ